MSTTPAPKPKLARDQYTTVTPWLVSSSSAGLIDFMHAAFGAHELPNSRLTDPAGVIIHVVVQLGDAMLQLFDSRPGWEPTPSLLNLYVENVVQTHQRALALGATSVTEVTELWYGEKVCRILDPFGNLWWLVERVEELDFTKPETKLRAATPDAVAGVAYIQRSLNEAMLAQKHFFAASQS